MGAAKQQQDDVFAKAAWSRQSSGEYLGRRIFRQNERMITAVDNWVTPDIPITYRPAFTTYTITRTCSSVCFWG